MIIKGVDLSKFNFNMACSISLQENRGWRWGQAVFNTAYNTDPEWADKWRGSEIDPFHDDQNVGVFMLQWDLDHVKVIN